jgi:hypothetical protein
MAWFDTHQAAVDPDNPAANEQITFDEWNAMVTYIKDKIIDKAVNNAAIGNDKILVYKTATSTFVFEAQSAVGAINDLTNVTISGVPADNEVLAYNTGTSEWINQTAAEAGLATVAGLAAYYPLSGATLTGDLNMGDYTIDDVNDIQSFDPIGIIARDSSATNKIVLASTTYAFIANSQGNMNTNKIVNVVDPTAAQEASTKNYDDTHLFTKEAVTSFTDGYTPVYRTASGKFEMEAAGGSAGLPVADTTSIVKGSGDGTKLMRFEVDGLTTGTTRVMTVPDKDMTIADKAEVMLLSGTQAMTSSINMGGKNILALKHVYGYSDSAFMIYQGGLSVYSPSVYMYGKDHFSMAGYVNFLVPDAAKTALLSAMRLLGGSDTPIVEIGYGLDMNAADIDDIGALILNGTTELTISAGVITATQTYHRVDTESMDPTDDLVTINGGTEGHILIIRASDTDRTVVVKDGTGNLQLTADMSLDNTQDTLTMIYDGTNWLEISRANNGA